MAQLGEVVHRYHEILENSEFRGMEWAEELQNGMRSRGLSDSGRLVSPVLRPCFLSRPQANRLAEACSQVASLLTRVESSICQSPEMLQRLQMLPAEKVLATADCKSARSGFAYSMETVVQNGCLRVSAVETCNPVGLGYSQQLTDLFFETPVADKFRKAGFETTRLGSRRTLLTSVRKLWREFRNGTPPSIAVVEGHTHSAQTCSEGRLVAGMLSDSGATARVCAPEQFEYSKGVLRAASQPVDVVFRRFAARDLLVHSDLSHPLLRAYREAAACVVNGFKSEAVRRCAILDLIADGPLSAGLSPAERETVQRFIPWTRILSRRRTTYGNQEVDLLSFARKHRGRLTLRPLEDDSGKQTYTGSGCDQSNWERALQAAGNNQYVLQERLEASEPFPLFQYGDLQMKQLRVTIHAHVIEGELHGAVAQLHLPAQSGSRPVALAPVVVVEGVSEQNELRMAARR